MEMHYDRPETPTSQRCTDIVVFFVPDIASAVPSMKDFAVQWKEVENVKAEQAKKESSKAQEKSKGEKTDDTKAEDKDKTEKEADDKEKPQKQKEDEKTKSKMPSKPCLLSVTSSSKEEKFRTMMLSLDGLLDYDESDRYEATFEASLFGELFHEMLQKEYAQQILQALIAVPKARRSPSPEPDPSDKASRKRQRESSKSPPATTKKAKPEPNAEPKEQQDPQPALEDAPSHLAENSTGEIKQEETPTEQPTEQATAIPPSAEGEQPPAPMEAFIINEEAQDGGQTEMETDQRPAEDSATPTEATPVASQMEGVVQEDNAATAIVGLTHNEAAEQHEQVENAGDQSVGESSQHSAPETYQGPPPLVEGEALAVPSAEGSELKGEGAADATVKQESDQKGTDQKPVEDKNAAIKAKRLAEEKEKDIKNQVARSELVRAFRYFDRNGVGYLKNEDVEALLHCLDAGLSRRFVHSLVNNASDIHQRKLFYTPLAEKLLKLGFPLPPVGYE